MSKEITFTPALFKKLKSAYNKAVKENKDSFVFEGDEWLTSYAKYVIEYLTPKFKNK
jgi:hypothetical protein